MTQQLWLKKLKLKYNSKVLDIVQFGSSVLEGKVPNDIDIAVLFDKVSLKEQLEYSQQIKRQLEEYTEIPIHVTPFDMYGLFDTSNFARESILFLGKSIIHGVNFVKSFGLIPKVQIYYSLDRLEKKDKIRFNYMLSGSGGVYGLLRKYNGNLLKPGLIEVNPEDEYIFIDSIKKFNIDYNVKKVLSMQT